MAWVGAFVPHARKPKPAEPEAAMPTYVPSAEELALAAANAPGEQAGSSDMTIAATASSLSERVEQALARVEKAAAATEAKFIARVAAVEQKGLNVVARMDSALEQKAQVHEQALEAFERQVSDMERATNGGPKIDPNG